MSGTGRLLGAFVIGEMFGRAEKEKARHEDEPYGIGRVSSRWIEFTFETDHCECRFRYEEKVGFC